MTLMRCFSGGDVNLALPSPAAIRIRDIAHHLACINRFSGAAPIPYNVAQHSCVVARIVEQLHAEPLIVLQALLHDAHEAFTSDVPTPTQAALPEGRAELKALQLSLDVAIYVALGMPAPTEKARDAIKFADGKAFATEWRAMMPGQIPAGYPEPATFNIKALPWHQAEEKFLKEYERLTMLAGCQPKKFSPVPTGIIK